MQKICAYNFYYSSADGFMFNDMFFILYYVCLQNPFFFVLIEVSFIPFIQNLILRHQVSMTFGNRQIKIGGAGFTCHKNSSVVSFAGKFSAYLSNSHRAIKILRLSNLTHVVCAVSTVQKKRIKYIFKVFYVSKSLFCVPPNMWKFAPPNGIQYWPRFGVCFYSWTTSKVYQHSVGVAHSRWRLCLACITSTRAESAHKW